jgi:hypothetical protein
VLEQQLERLAQRGINLLPAAEISTHFIFERDGFVALVERKPDGFGNIGAPGLLIENAGFAALVWRAEAPWFVGRGYQQPATAAQVELIRKFADDLNWALKFVPGSR